MKTDLKIFSRMIEAGRLRNSSGLARALGVTPQAISNYRKRGVFPAALAMKFSERFGVSVDWLITGEGEPMRSGQGICRKELESEDAVYIERMLVLLHKGDRTFSTALKTSINVFYSAQERMDRV